MTQQLPRGGGGVENLGGGDALPGDPSPSSERALLPLLSPTGLCGPEPLRVSAERLGAGGPRGCPTPVGPPAPAGLGGRAEEAEQSWGGGRVGGHPQSFSVPEAAQPCLSQEKAEEQVARSLGSRSLRPLPAPTTSPSSAFGSPRGARATWPGGGT